MPPHKCIKLLIINKQQELPIKKQTNNVFNMNSKALAKSTKMYHCNKMLWAYPITLENKHILVP